MGSGESGIQTNKLTITLVLYIIIHWVPPASWDLLVYMTMDNKIDVGTQCVFPSLGILRNFLNLNQSECSFPDNLTNIMPRNYQAQTHRQTVQM